MSHYISGTFKEAGTLWEASFSFWNTLKQTLYFRIDADRCHSSFIHFPSKRKKFVFSFSPTSIPLSLSPQRNGPERSLCIFWGGYIFQQFFFHLRVLIYMSTHLVLRPVSFL